MPYTATHRTQVKEKLIQSAQRLFNRHGFAKVSIDDVMLEAGLTRGSFYGYFKSKSDLYAQSIARVVDEKREAAGDSPAPRFTADQIVRDYLSARHFEDVDGSCPMIGLPSDISHADPAVRHAFEDALKLMIEIFEGEIDGAGRGRRDRALAIAALCVGGMVLARSVEDRKLADELRSAATTTALTLGAWP